MALRRRRPVPHWELGILEGPSPLELPSGDGARRLLEPELLVDLGLVAAADPFGLHHGGRWWVLFEAVPEVGRRGRVDAVVSDDLVTWQHAGTLLEEPFHVSYPCVIADDSGEVCLVPETSAIGEVRLYRTPALPGRFSLDRVLLKGRAFKDSTVFRHGGRWWMLSETSARHTNDELRLYGADDLAGPWAEHPASPVVVGDASIARPAGPPVVVDGRLFRFAQDCSGGYGRRVLAVEITELTPGAYAERRLGEPLLPSEHPSGWRPRAMHHLDAHAIGRGWVSFVDGRP
jgi:hypothetical protein